LYFFYNFSFSPCLTCLANGKHQCRKLCNLFLFLVTSSTETKNEKWDEKFNIFRCLRGERKFGESTLLRARSFMDFPTLLKILLILVVITCFGLIIWASSSNKKTQKSIHIDDYQVCLSLFMVITVCGVSSSRIQNYINFA
jgi:hypothetical protein